MSSEMCSKMPMAPMICSFARKGMASHTSGALMPSVTDGRRPGGAEVRTGARGRVAACARGSAELTALGHVRCLRRWEGGGRTVALRSRERELNAVRVEAVADEASHGDAAVLDLRMAQPACQGSARREHAGSMAASAGTQAGGAACVHARARSVRDGGGAHRSQPPHPGSRAARQPGQSGPSSRQAGSAPSRALCHNRRIKMSLGHTDRRGAASGLHKGSAC